jgi:predicted nucleotidyltransferase
MAGDTEKSDLHRMAEILARHAVEFIVIGGQAETLLGSARVTFDVDLCYCRSRGNLERLAAALKEIKPTLRDAPPDLPIVLDVQALSLGSNYTFDTSLGKLDLLGWVEPLGDYEALLPSVEVYTVGGMELKVIGLDDLIRVKEHIGRPRDRDSLYQLLAIKRIRLEGGGNVSG